MKKLAFALGALSLALIPQAADAAPPWVDRSLTLPRHDFAFDGGLGLGHGHIRGLGRDFFGPGINLEGTFGITDELELGFRTGLRLGDDARAVGADAYGRTFFLDTWGVGGDVLANPEFKIRYNVYQGSIVEVGLDGRVYLPIEQNTDFGLMFGVPLAFHVANSVRIDTGAYIPTVFHNPTFAVLSIPGYFWFQTSEKLWLGPLAEIRLNLQGYSNNLLLGFGLGYQFTSALDLKTWILLPSVNHQDDFNLFGLGVGVQIRVE